MATQKDEAYHEELPQGEGMLKGDTHWWQAAATCFWRHLPLPEACGSCGQRAAAAGNGFTKERTVSDLP